MLNVYALPTIALPWLCLELLGTMDLPAVVRAMAPHTSRLVDALKSTQAAIPAVGSSPQRRQQVSPLDSQSAPPSSSQITGPAPQASDNTPAYMHGMYPATSMWMPP
jgi:hypothetical protein